MADLTASSAFDGLLPIRHGAVEAADWQPGAITSVAPRAGREAAVSAALEAEIGVALPPPGQIAARDGATILWAGLDRWFVLGPGIGARDDAALTDQSDAWAAATLSGAGARDVLARLTPVDLRPDMFGPAQVARTLVGHMPCILLRQDADSFGIMVFRSMAGTAAHELDRAMRAVAARAARD